MEGSVEKFEQERAMLMAINSLIPVLQCDLEGRVLSCSESARALFSEDAGDIEGRSLTELLNTFAGVGTENVSEAALQKAATGEVWSDLILFSSLADSLLPAFATFLPVRDATGKIEKVSVLIQRATEGQKNVALARLLDRNRALESSAAILELDPAGAVLYSSENFELLLGYDSGELEKRLHPELCDESLRSSGEYKKFWSRLLEGEVVHRNLDLVSKDGEPVIVRATLYPVFDEKGRVARIVKLVVDVTEETLRFRDFSGQIEAIGEAQAVIEFDVKGYVLAANDNFCSLMGVKEADIKGSHHRIFCDKEYTDSKEYAEFWESLGRGEFRQGEFTRYNSKGEPVWIMASYSPVRNSRGEVVKIVKFAVDRSADKRKIYELLSSFEAAAGDLDKSVATLREDADGMAATFSTTLQESESAATAVEQLSGSVQTVGQSTHEMTATISEISRSTANASVISSKALEYAGDASRVMKELEEASTEIDTIVKVISQIARQTNLLALNSTIEAARAGEAGLGFAVVANEVKELAKQTTNSTEDIAKTIEGVRGISAQAVNAMSKIAEIIGEIDGISTSTAAAVEEQAVTTAEVSRTVEESARSLLDLRKIVEGVADVTKTNALKVKSTKTAAQKLSCISEDLSKLVRKGKEA